MYSFMVVAMEYMITAKTTYSKVTVRGVDHVLHSDHHQGVHGVGGEKDHSLSSSG